MKNKEHEPVAAVRPLAGYVGGKRALAARLIERIAATPHGVYVEPFVGMGGVFFRRKGRPKVEAINDYSKDVATFFRVLQRHYQAFLDMLKWQIVSRAEFARLAALDPDTLTDLERAARFLYLQRLSYGGKVTSRSFGYSALHPGRFDVSRLAPMLEAAHERLSGVYIDCLPWRDFVERWDRAETLFYLDPPYFGSEHYYGKGLFAREEFEALAARLATIKGRFILSLNDVPEIRDLFSFARIDPVQLNYFVEGGKATPARELIISSRVRR